ncbi:arylamine N-acetyltransferase family protein [Zobellia galactanivorans]|uniref:arylamine N-acetyltransferase family protein n=1 Tax=Zobellia galactanivorans (strain DSM 12802 / CCUG 47099 / CIP 106680 / NCIMB 13871 / Dsij) TaxID=63186 RepID=UPI001C07988B|nr:arylamine N-acetyltransferase [Zobellia galactanivorans]MBU3026386.1 arylamine N-acetyltransferase [Zobellia galactanivorans]
MNTYKFDINKYLKRIGFKDTIAINLDSLIALHQAQCRTIPFENFDICLGKPIDISPRALEGKLVGQKRGGYCAELNGLFLLALESLGFGVRNLLGRVHLNGVPTGRGHRLILVSLEGKKWLVDTGFGVDNPKRPIPLICNSPVSFENQILRILKSEHYGFMLQSKQDGDWKNLYSFDLDYVCPMDIEYGNHYTSTHPNSFFVNARVAALPIGQGMISLHNRTLTKRIAGEKEVKVIDEGQAYLSILKKEFGIHLNVDYADFKPLL